MVPVRVRDVVLAVGACAVVLAWTLVIGPAIPAIRRPDAFACLLAGAGALALAWRRRAPLGALAATTATLTTYLALGYPYGPGLLTFAATVYTVARYLPWRTAAAAGSLAFAVLPLHILTTGDDSVGALGLVPAAAWIAVPFAIGSTLAQRGEAAVRARREAVERGVQQERLRVAQEVHDIVGHGLTAIKMQADVALHLLATRPEYARPTLEAVSRTSAQALKELRSTLRMVRAEAGSASSTPGLADLDALYRRMRDAGLRVRVRTTGTPGGLPPDAELAAYRTVQESLTNVLKHAERKEADIAIDHEPDGVRIRVTSPCPGPVTPVAGGGTGIAGMRERLAAQGGRLTAGPEPAGRFVVQAWLPGGSRP